MEGPNAQNERACNKCEISGPRSPNRNADCMDELFGGARLFFMVTQCPMPNAKCHTALNTKH